VFSVETLDDSLDVLEAIREGGDLDSLPTCTAR
jgi:PDZ domain-containing protein